MKMVQTRYILLFVKDCIIYNCIIYIMYIYKKKLQSEKDPTIQIRVKVYCRR